MSDGFTKAGYGAHSVGFGARPAVIVVDFQHGFTHPGFRMGQSPHVQRAVENTAVLLKDARRRQIPVATCNVAWGSDRDMGYWKISPLYSGWFYGEPATRMDERIHDPAYDFHFTKSAPSMFFGTPLITFLTKARVDTVIVTGVATSGCVRATIVDSFSHGYRTMVPEECCGDMEEGPHHDNLRDVGRRYADVVTLKDVLAYFADRSDDPGSRL
ncbi:MAG: isochorismatase family protein [Gammaproteobacteria bacterium]|nr:isochorismatase family protein [Gammaproteobacteria bacterium]